MYFCQVFFNFYINFLSIYVSIIVSDWYPLLPKEEEILIYNQIRVLVKISDFATYLPTENGMNLATNVLKYLQLGNNVGYY